MGLDQVRAYWICTSYLGVANFERRRITMEAEKREQRRVDKTTTTMQCGCVMYVDRAASTSINELTEHKPFIITIIVLDDFDHHTGLRGIAREREREE